MWGEGCGCVGGGVWVCGGTESCVYGQLQVQSAHSAPPSSPTTYPFGVAHNHPLLGVWIGSQELVAIGENLFRYEATSGESITHIH